MVGRRLPPVRDWDWPFLSIVAVFVVWCGVFVQRTSFRVHGVLHYTLFDDAMVSMRYARNLTDGNGLVWNAGGERVEGYSNPLWTAWMAFLHLFPVSEAMLPSLVMLTSVAALTVNLYVVARIARALDLSRFACLAAVVLTASFYPLSYWSLRGMEVGVLALLINLAVLLALRLRTRPVAPRDLVLVCVVVGAALTVRIDALLPCALVAGFAWWFSRSSRVLAALAGTIAGVTIGMTLTRIAYYGDPLPNTYYLKATGVSLEQRFDAGAHALSNLLPGSGLGSTWLLAAAFALVALWPRARRFDSARLLLAAIALGQIAYSVYVGGDAWEVFGYANRYVTVAAPVLFVLAADGIDRIARAWRRSRSGQSISEPVIAVAMVAITALLVLSINGEPYRGWVDDNAELVTADAYGVELGICERAATNDDAVIAVFLAGNSPYYSHRESNDMLGKSDAYIAHLPVPSSVAYRPGHNKFDFTYSIEELRPDIVEGANYPWMASPDPATKLAMARVGYDLLPNGLAVRRDSPNVDATKVAAINRLDAESDLIAAC